MEGEINEQKGSVFEKLIDCNENCVVLFSFCLKRVALNIFKACINSLYYEK